MNLRHRFLSLGCALLIIAVSIAGAWPTSPCNPCVPRCTFTQGGWGAPCEGGNAGCLLQEHFTAAYPSGLTIGGIYTVHFTTSTAVEQFLPQGQAPAVLTHNYVNPPQTPYLSVFVGHVLALQLNVDFSSLGFGGMTPIANLQIATGAFAGYTVAQILVLANTVLGSDVSALPAGTTLPDLSAACAAIDLNFDNCVNNDGYLITPPAGATAYVRDVGQDLPAAFCLNFTLQCPDICVVWWCQHCDESRDFASFTVTPGCTGPDCNDACTPNPGELTGFEISNQHLIGPDPSGNGCWWYALVHATEPGCFCVTFDSQLPVNLTDFAAVAGNNAIRLRWTTASETRNDYFELLRDGLTIAKIPTLGNDATGHQYSYFDDRVVDGTVYHYTLTAVDINGIRQELQSVDASPVAGIGTVTEYALHQNYPNPFNPTTSIAVDLMEAGRVSLKVYNLMGQEVASLVNSNLSSGRHIVSFDASRLSSGVYLYRVSVNGFVAEKKMLLMK